MSNAIDIIVSKQALDGLKELHRRLLTCHEEIIKINQTQITFNTGAAAKTIADLNKAIEASNKLTTSLNQQSNAHEKLNKEINAANQSRQRYNRMTAEEIVNSRALRQNADLHARANSKLAGAYENLSARVKIAEKNYLNIIARGKTAEQTQRQYNRELRNAQNEFERLNKKVLEADKAVGRWNRTGERSIGFLSNLAGAFGVVGGVTLFATMTRDVYQNVKVMNSLDQALKAVTGTAEDHAAQMQFIIQISQSYGLALNETMQQYTRFYASAKEKLSNSELQELFENIARSGAVMGLSIEQQEGAFRALEQMLSKGNVQAEEIRGQLSERLPGAFNILARSMGVTTSELNKLLKEGKVIADEVLPKFAREYAKAVGADRVKEVETLVAAQNRLSNEWIMLIRNIEENDGVLSKFFIGGIKLAKDFLALLGEINSASSSAKKLSEIKTNEGYQLQIQKIRDLTADANKTDLERNEIIKGQQKYAQERRDFYLWEIRGLQMYVDEQKKIAAEGKAINLGLGNYVGTSDAVEALKEAEAANEKIRELSKQYGFYNGVVKATIEHFTVMTKAKIADTGATKQNTKAAKEYDTSYYKIIKLQYENQIKYNELIMTDEDQSFERRKNAAKSVVDHRLKLSKLIYDEEIRVNAAKLKDDLRIDAAEVTNKEKSASDALKIIKEAQNNQIISWIHYADRRKAILEDEAKYLRGVFEAISDAQEVDIIDQKQIDDIRQLNLELANLSVNSNYEKFAELEKRKVQITEDAAERRTEIELRRVQAQMKWYDEENQHSIAYMALKKKEAELIMSLEEQKKKKLEESAQLAKELKEATDEYLSSFRTDFFSDAGLDSLNTFFEVGKDGMTEFQRLMKGAGDDIGKQFAVTFNAMAELASEFFTFMSQMSQDNFEAEYSRLERQRDVAMQFAGESSTAKAEIDRIYERKRIEIERRQAKSERDAAMFGIAINTAQAIVSTLAQTPPPAGLPLAFLVGAIGAAQLAAVASRPLPQFEHGTRNAPEGWAIVDEKRPEVHTDKDGNIVSTGSDKGPNLRYMKAGDKVYKSHQDYLNEVLEGAGIMKIGQRDPEMNFSGITADEMDIILKRNLGSRPVANFGFDKNGFYSNVISNGQKTINTDNRASGIGSTF